MATVPQRKSYYFVVRVPAIESKGYMKDYVADAVKRWKWGYPANSPVLRAPDRAFTVRNTLYELERETLMNLKKDVARYFNANELPSGTYCDVMKIIDGYLSRA